MNALTLGLIAALCWAIHDITVRKLSQSVPLASALLVVLFVGVVFQFGLVLSSDVEFAFNSIALLQSLAAGLAFLVASICLYMAFKRGPVKLVSPIIAAYPILSLVFAAITGTEINVGHLCAVALIIAGVGIVAGLSDKTKSDAPAYGPTIILSLLSAIGWASTFWLGQMASSSIGELPATLVTRLTAFLVLAAILLMMKRQSMPDKKAYGPLIIMGILDGIALLSVLAAGNKPNPEFAAIASSMFGLLTVILAVLFLKERMSKLQWIGVLLAFIGIGYLGSVA